jgi:hypothetical protein
MLKLIIGIYYKQDFAYRLKLLVPPDCKGMEFAVRCGELLDFLTIIALPVKLDVSNGCLCRLMEENVDLINLFI